MKTVPRHARNTRFSNPRQRKQQHLLDVKIRVTKERARRNKAILRVAFKLILFGSLIAGAWIGGKEAMRRFVWENPDYFLRDVRVTTDGALTREQILAAAEIVEGTNIFLVDLTKAREGVEKLPQVESAEIQRLLPNRVTISIAERQPIAWVCSKYEETPSASERSFLIDARGVVMRSRTILPEYWVLPIISGFETENLAAGQHVAALEMKAALELIRLNADSTRFEVRNVDLSKGYCLIVTDQRQAKIQIGLDRIEAQLARLNGYIDRATQDRKELRTINLQVERNTPVTFRDEQTEADLAAEAARANGPANRGGVKPGSPAKAGAVSAIKGKPTPTARKTPADGIKKRFFEDE